MPVSKKSKGKRKGKKGKKGKKKDKVVPEPLPLHILTEIYKKIDTLVRQLIDARVIARKKRKEAEFLEKEQESMKRDGVVFREHLNDLLLDVQNELLNTRTLIDKERESIAKEVIKVNAELDRKLIRTYGLIEEAEKRVGELQKSLLEFKSLREMVTQTIEKLRLLTIEYNRLRIEMLIKTTHLRNQYLNFRADLYNYLQEQLIYLISKVRSYLMPILWDQMEKLCRENRCHRWNLIKIDEINFKLLDERNKLLKKVETLDGEEQYYGTEWVFVKINEMQERNRFAKRRWKNRLRQIYKNRNLTQHYKKIKVVIEETPRIKVVEDFREFLQKRLGAIAEAKERQEKMEKQREIQTRNKLFKKNQAFATQRRENYILHDRNAAPVLDVASTKEDEVLPITPSIMSISSRYSINIKRSRDQIYDLETETNRSEMTSRESVSSSSIISRSSVMISGKEKKVSIARSKLNIVEEEEEEEE